MIKDDIYIKELMPKLYKNKVNLIEFLVVIFFLIFFNNDVSHKILSYNIEDDVLYFNDEIVLNIPKIKYINNKLFQSINNDENKHIEKFISVIFFSIKIYIIFLILKSIAILREFIKNIIYCIMYIYNKSRKRDKICNNKLSRLCFN